ncbi:hypothetical protein [Streptomyces sp. NPDC058086]|uniref:hypothetical protein n=1 Tax=Streptomyces sp. NPDC058086 TaxID=3346334 RepID=UPI0036E08BF6
MQRLSVRAAAARDPVFHAVAPAAANVRLAVAAGAAGVGKGLFATALDDAAQRLPRGGP